MFLIPINGYIHVVPFVVDDENNFVLKTVFPSRRFHKKLGGKKA
ncbi:MAG: BrnT family toxin [Bacteroidetes bacterium]|nr:BrnT family toxin [Bacteroidota bacterium]